MTKPLVHWITATAVLAISLYCFPPPARAAENLQMAVRPGFAGAAKVGTWVPIEVELQNTGAETSGELQIQVDAQTTRGAWNRPPVSYNAPVSLPSRSRKRVSLEVFLPGQEEKVNAQFVAAGQTLAKQEVTVDRVAASELFCGLMTGSRSALDFLTTVDLGGPQRRVRLARLDPVDIPQAPYLLQSLDCLILANVSTAGLADRQKSALSQWVDGGGLLIVGGGSGLQKTLGPLPPDLLPVKIGGNVAVPSLGKLAEFAERPLPESGPWLVGNATVTDGIAVVEQDGVPLLVGARRGLGSVVYLGLDPTAEPLRSWEGSERLWRHLLTYGPSPQPSFNNQARPHVAWGRIPRTALADLTGSSRGSSDWLLYLLLSYAVAVGPVNYALLRRFGRPEWGLATIPLITLLAGGLALAGARSNPASDYVMSNATILRSWNGETALARSYVGVFSLRQQTPELQLPPGSLVSPQFYPFPYEGTMRANPADWALNVRAGDHPGIDGFSLRPGGLGTFSVDSTYRLPGRILANLVADETGVRGEVVSRLARPLRSTAVIVGGDVVRLGDFRPGEAKPVSVDLTPGPADLSSVLKLLYPTDDEPAPKEEAALRDLIQSALGPSSIFGARVDVGVVTLIGWLDDAPIGNPIRSNRTTPVQRTLLISSLGVRPSAGQTMRVPSSLLVRRSLLASGAGRVQGSSVTFSNGDALSWEYQLPFDLSRFVVDDLRFEVAGQVQYPGVRSATSLAGLGSAHFYDWRRAEWVLVDLEFGENRLGDPQRFVSPLGVVRFRYVFRAPVGPQPSSSSATASFSAFDLAVRGRAP